MDIDLFLNKFVKREKLLSSRLLCYCISMSISTDNIDKFKYFVEYFSKNISSYNKADINKIISVLYYNEELITKIIENEELFNLYKINDFFLHDLNEETIKQIKEKYNIKKYSFEHKDNVNEYVKNFFSVLCEKY